MNGLINENDLAELIIYSDAIQEILSQYKFKYSSKFEFNKVNKAVKNIINEAFGHSDIGELDDWVFELRNFTKQLIKDKVYLKETT